jgi:hypothetical protein
MSDIGPRLLIEWSSPWQEFVSAIGPALGRSPVRLAGEARTGLVPLRGMLLCWGTQAIFIAAFIWLSANLPSLHPYVPRTPSKVEVIYFSPDELPPVQDLGGAAVGRSGRAGGKEVHHHSQAIRVARGNPATEKVVDAPNLKLPISNAPVANLLAFKANPGPPPAEGLKSSRTTPTLSKDALLAPPPEVLRDRTRATPGLSSTVIAPPPSTPQRSRQTMGLSTTIIAPAPQQVPRDQSHSVIAMNSPIIQPAPDVPRDPPPLRGPTAASTTVVPPPVSAPPRDPSSSPKLSLPTPGVIAPPPSQVTRDLRTTGATLADPKVVPPPVQLGGRSQDKHAIPGLVGANQVVPPPPSVTNGTSLSGGGHGQNDKPGGFGTTLTADNVVPPPPGVSRDASLSGASRGAGTSLGGNVVVPPPPNLSSAGGSLSGRGTGSKGGGLGGPLDLGSSVVAPPTGGGSNASGTGVVVSNQPGSAKGIPGNGAPGAIAMSPAGTAKTGIGGSGDGNGIGRGNAPGSGLAGEGSGAAKAGTGRGSDPSAHGGTSPYPGTGGTGSGTSGQPAVPGVNVSGGSAIVTLPSFGSSENDPSVPGRSPTGGARGDFDITVEGTSRSGGALNRYGQLKGEKVYTKYFSTGYGPVVMQLVGPSDLTSPRPLRTDSPAGLKRSHLEIACVLDRSGSLQNMQVLRADDGAPTSKVIAALHTWKFTPAFRGDEPVEVNAILGFNVNTN